MGGKKKGGGRGKGGKKKTGRRLYETGPGRPFSFSSAGIGSKARNARGAEERRGSEKEGKERKTKFRALNSRQLRFLPPFCHWDWWIFSPIGLVRLIEHLPISNPAREGGGERGGGRRKKKASIFLRLSTPFRPEPGVPPKSRGKKGEGEKGSAPYTFLPSTISMLVSISIRRKKRLFGKGKKKEKKKSVFVVIVKFSENRRIAMVAW